MIDISVNTSQKVTGDCLRIVYSGVLSLGVPGVPWLPTILANQLTLSQPGERGRLCPPNNTGTPGFSDPPTALIFIAL